MGREPEKGEAMIVARVRPVAPAVTGRTAPARLLSVPPSIVAGMDATEHWQAWLDRYGADYESRPGA